MRSDEGFEWLESKTLEVCVGEVVMVEEREEEEEERLKRVGIQELGKGKARGRGNMLGEGAIRK